MTPSDSLRNAAASHRARTRVPALAVVSKRDVFRRGAVWIACRSFFHRAAKCRRATAIGENEARYGSPSGVVAA